MGQDLEGVFYNGDWNMELKKQRSKWVLTASWTDDLNWTYTRRLENVLDVF